MGVSWKMVVLKMDSLVHGKSHLQMDDENGVPPMERKTHHMDHSTIRY